MNDKPKTARFPKTRATLTLVFLALYAAFSGLYSKFGYMVQAEAGLSQFENDPITIGIGQWFSTSNVPGQIALGLLLVVLLIIWVPYFSAASKANR